MPNKPHPPRGGGSKKPPPQQNGEDTSFIVFSNAKGEPKKGKRSETTVNSSQVGKDTGKEKGKDQPGQAADDAPKKPDTRTLIGGASWTGKLPVNLLSEHCQKQGWANPEYIRVGNQS